MGKKCLLIIFILLLVTCDRGYCVTDIVEKEEIYGSATSEIDIIGAMSPINYPKITKVLKSLGLVIVIIVVTFLFLRKKK